MYTLLVSIPDDLIAAVAQDGGVDLGLVIELLEVVMFIDLAEELLGSPGSGPFAFEIAEPVPSETRNLRSLQCQMGRGRIAGQAQSLHQEAGAFIDRNLSIVEHELAVA